MTILDALKDENLFGALAVFRDLTSWRAWLTFLSALYGLPLPPEEVARFCRHTGRSSYNPPRGGWREAACIVGRQSGKTRVAALVAGFESICARPEDDRTATYALMVAQDQRGAMRSLFRYAVAPFESVPLLERSVMGRTADSVTLDSGVVLAAYPCRPAGTRGLRARVVVCDELAFYIGTEGNPTDREMLRATRPCLATTGGRLLILSSPYGQTGALWDLHRAHYGRESPVLVWQASAPEMNPTLPQNYIQRMQEEDPEAFRSEVLGEFRAGVASLFDPEALDACVVTGRRELPPVPGLQYRAFVDPSGGRSDAFSVAIAHRAGDLVVVDLLRAWRPPFNPGGVVEEAAAILRSYSVSNVTGDRYAGEWPREAFRAHGVSYLVAEQDKSGLYLSLLADVNSARIELPDLPDLLRELRGLVRRRGTSGRDRIDHAPGAHDDLANAVGGLASLLRAGPWRNEFAIYWRRLAARARGVPEAEIAEEVEREGREWKDRREERDRVRRWQETIEGGVFPA